MVVGTVRKSMRFRSAPSLSPAAVVECPRCHGPLVLSVATSLMGPLVSSRCATCQVIVVPYQGPGASEAIAAWKARSR
jgi:hypothetical protein